MQKWYVFHVLRTWVLGAALDLISFLNCQMWILIVSWALWRGLHKIMKDKNSLVYFFRIYLLYIRHGVKMCRLMKANIMKLYRNIVEELKFMMLKNWRHFYSVAEFFAVFCGNGDSTLFSRKFLGTMYANWASLSRSGDSMSNTCHEADILM